MSVKQSLNILPNQRVDIPDLRHFDSSVIFDFKTLMETFISSKSFIVRGFDITYSTTPESMVMNIAESALWTSTEKEGSVYTAPVGTDPELLSSSNPRVSGAFSLNTRNYVGLKLVRNADTTTTDLVTLWDADSEKEYTITAPRGLVLGLQIVISQTGFTDLIPVAMVDVNGSGSVTALINAKNELCRLGKGGIIPNALYNSTDLDAKPLEGDLTQTSPAQTPNPFEGGDHEIKDLKAWMDYVMTQIKRIMGSQYWYTDGPSSNNGVNLLDLFNDTAASLITGKGKFIHAGAGDLQWTSDLLLRSIIGPRYYRIPGGNVLMTDKQVAYITLVRNVEVDPNNRYTFDNTNPTNQTVTGLIPIVGVIAGDWVKAAQDPEAAWRQVKSVLGNVITLWGPTDVFPNTQVIYPFYHTNAQMLLSKGSYSVQVANPENVPANGNTYWLAKRDDQSFTTQSIQSVARTSDYATITSASHGLVAGQQIVISGLSDTSFNGVQEITSVPTANTFLYLNQGDDVATTAMTGTIDASAKIYLRAIGELGQGRSQSIDDTIPSNILQYIGASSDSQSTPVYSDVSDGSLVLGNYNGIPGENLTTRLSKLTAMLADVQQNYNTEVDMGSVTWEGTTTVTPGTNTVANNTNISGGFSTYGSIINGGISYISTVGFSLVSTEDVTNLSLALAKGAVGTGTIAFEIRSVVAGVPQATVLKTSSTVNVASLPLNVAPAYSIVSFTFPAGTLPAGTYCFYPVISNPSTQVDIVEFNAPAANIPAYSNFGIGWGTGVRKVYISATAAGTGTPIIVVGPATLSFTGATLSIPGTVVGSAPVPINNVTNLTLTDNQCVYVDINRSSPAALNISSPTLLSALTPSQQRLVLVRRIGLNVLVRS